MLAFVCALVKNEGWRDEHEYRLLFVPENFGDEYSDALPRPDHRGSYIPFRWTADKSPIRAIMPHPLADEEIVRDVLRKLRQDNISVISSELRPRAQKNDEHL